MRGSVLPRDVAARIIASAVARAGWVSAAVNLLLAVSALYLASLSVDREIDLTVPFLALAAMLAALAVLLWRPSNRALVLYLLVGAGSIYFYQAALLAQEPLLQQEDAYLLNRPAMALVLMGTASARPLPAVFWGIAGFAAGQLAMVAATMQLGLPLASSTGPVLTLLVYCGAYLVLAGMLRAQEKSLSVLLAGGSSGTTTDKAEMLRTPEMVRETVLNNLAYLINGPAQLDSHARARLRGDADLLAMGEWDFDASHLRDPADATFRNQMLTMISDLQWRGLTVNVSGNPHEVLPLSDLAGGAALDGTRNCLESVLKHSSTSAAELILGNSGESVTIMIIGSGSGLGRAGDGPMKSALRPATVRAIEGCGGSVRTWSVPNQGTCVLISVPAMGSAVAEVADADA